MAKSHKKKSKRKSCKKKFKITKNVAEHKRKFRRELKKNSKLRKLIDPSDPNHLAFENDVLAAELRKQRVEDLREVQKDSRLKLQMENRNLEDLIDEATQKVKDFKMCYDHAAENSNLKYRSNHMEVKKLVAISDVILEVLDARDPLGSRCPQVEQLVLNTGKRLVLVLNKIDLIPKKNLTEWLKYLRQEVPTVAFKASVETQDEYLSQSENSLVCITESLLASRCCVGASFLINILENYSRNQNLQTLIKVGIVGFPNVGKSSVIKSLKQFYSCSDGEATDITNAIKQLSLNKHFEILDYSGIVYPKDDSPVNLALHNTVKVEDLKDVISPAEAILQKVDHIQFCLHYCVPRFSSSHEFLCSLAAKLGKFKNSDNPDFEDGARRLIHDWNSGKIKYYTHPPENFIRSKFISSEYITQMSKIFDISLEKEQIELDKAPLLFPVVTIPSESSGPTEGLLEKGVEANNYVLAEVITEFNTNKENVTGVEDESNKLLTEYQLHKFLKKSFKKMKRKIIKHKKKKFDELALALSESVDTSLTLE